MKKLIIGYSPLDGGSNSYTESFKRILSVFGKVVKTPSLKEVVTFRMPYSYDLLIFNWSDSAFINNKTGLVDVFGVVKAFLRLFVFKTISKKVVFVRHNVYPHNTSFKSKKLATKLINIYERFFDACWVHSGHFTENFRLYVPHPLYQLAANEDPLFAEINLPDKFFIVFGRIVPYKKIDKLIEALPDDVNLVVCGSCSDDAYLGKLLAHKKSNVTIIPKYISDDLAKDMIAQSLGVVICHSDEDMIVSGSIIFAVSVGAPVIAIETPFVAWFQKNINAKMITSVAGFPELAESMRSFQPQIDNADILSCQSHFCDQSVQAKVKISLNQLGLI